MKDLHFRRALGFIVLYLCSIFVLGTVWLWIVNSREEFMSTAWYVAYQIGCIPIILILAKWYFKKIQPSFKRGVVLGVCTVFFLNVFLIIMAMFSLRTGLPGGGLHTLALVLGDIYTEWRIYFAMMVVLVTTAYAGFEFDRTYTFADGVLRKKK